MINISTEMQGYYSNDPGIPEYINMLKDDQKKASHACLPTRNNILVAISSNAVLAANHPPRMTKTWEALSHSKKTWATWKTNYCKAHITRQCQILVSEDRGENFGSAKAATCQRKPPTADWVSFDNTDPSEATIDRLNVYLDNLSNVVTN